MTILIGLLFLGVAIKTAQYFRSAWYKQKFLRDALVESTAGVRPGLCAVEGRAEPVGEAVKAPISGRECIGYSYEIQREVLARDDGKSRVELELEDRGTHCQPFWVKDREGQVLVVGPKEGTGRLELDIRNHTHYETDGKGFWGSLSAKIGDKLGLRKHEKRLPCGAHVVAMGNVRAWVRGVKAAPEAEEERIVLRDSTLPESGYLLTTHYASAGSDMPMFRVFDRGARRIIVDRLGVAILGAPVSALLFLIGLLLVAGGAYELIHE